MEYICPFARSFICSKATTPDELPQAVYLLPLPLVYEGTSAPLAEYSCTICWSLGACVCVLLAVELGGGGGGGRVWGVFWSVFLLVFYAFSYKTWSGDCDCANVNNNNNFVLLLGLIWYAHYIRHVKTCHCECIWLWMLSARCLIPHAYLLDMWQQRPTDW